MKKRTKKYVKIGSIIAAVLLLLLFIRVPIATPLNAIAPIAGGASSTGGGGGGTPTNSEIPLLFVPFSWLGFKIPFINIPSIDIPIITFPVPEGSILKVNGDSCSSNTQCSSGYCNLGNKAIGQCEDKVRIDNSDSLRTITPECSRQTDCNKCANADYDTCLNGVCVCQAPVIDTSRTIDTTSARTTVECTRSTQCSKCANAAYDTCVNNVCVCQAPVVTCTSIVNPRGQADCDVMNTRLNPCIYLNGQCVLGV